MIGAAISLWHDMLTSSLQVQTIRMSNSSSWSMTDLTARSERVGTQAYPAWSSSRLISDGLSDLVHRTMQAMFHYARASRSLHHVTLDLAATLPSVHLNLSSAMGRGSPIADLKHDKSHSGPSSPNSSLASSTTQSSGDATSSITPPPTSSSCPLGGISHGECFKRVAQTAYRVSSSSPLSSL